MFSSIFLLTLSLSLSVHSFPQNQNSSPPSSSQSGATEAVATADSWGKPTYRNVAASKPNYYATTPPVEAPPPEKSYTPLGNTYAPQEQQIVAKNGDVYLNRLDATDAKSLVEMVKKVQNDYNQKPGDYNENSIRPFYADTTLVNEAYAIWNNAAVTDICKSGKGTAIFSTPPHCMENPSGPEPGTVMVNPTRVNVNKRSCIYTTVICVAPDVYETTVADIMDNLNKLKWDAPYFTVEPCYGPAKVVEEAWKEWSKVKLGGLDGVRTADGEICGKHSERTESNEGIHAAAFGTKDCLANGSASKCRKAYCQCV